MLSGAGGYILPGLSDQNQLFDFAVKGFDPVVIAVLFVISSADQSRIPWIAASGLVALESL